MRGHDLLAPTVTGYMMVSRAHRAARCALDGISCQYCCSECGKSTSVVTLLHKESHDFRPLPSPQLSPSEMHVDWETMVAWLTWTYIENGMELLMPSYAEVVHEFSSWGVCMQLCVHYLHVQSLYVYNGLIFLVQAIWIQGIVKCSQLWKWEWALSVLLHLLQESGPPPPQLDQDLPPPPTSLSQQ